MTTHSEHARDDATASSGAQDHSVPAHRRLLSKAQVAARLGCSERSLERLVKQGRFPAPRRYGRGVVWFEAAVEHVLALAEQEQLQWQPAATTADLADLSTSTPQAEAPAPSPLPEAHELEPEVLPQGRKPRKAASSNKRRAPAGAQAQDLHALRLVFSMPAA